MSVLYQSPDLALPWASSKREDRRFNIITLIVLLLALVLGLVIQNIQLRELTKDELTKVPDSVVKFMKKEAVKPPPPPPVVTPVEKPVEKEPEKKKEEKKPPPPKNEQEQKAREKAAKKISEMKNELANMQDMFKPVEVKTLSKGNTAAQADKKLIMGNATTTKGITTNAVSTSSGLAALSANAATEVGSGSLGGTQVDGSGAVAQAAAAKPKVDGQRSEEQIRAVLDSSKGALYAIYNRELRKDPSLQGRVTFEITIEPNGSVSACKIFSSELNNKALESKLVQRMGLINFGAADVAKTKTRWAIDFLAY